MSEQRSVQFDENDKEEHRANKQEEKDYGLLLGSDIVGN